MWDEQKALILDVKSDPAASASALRTAPVQALRGLLEDPEFLPILKRYNQTIEPLLIRHLGEKREFRMRELDRTILRGVPPRVAESPDPLELPFLLKYRPEWEALKRALVQHHALVQVRAKEALEAVPGPVTRLAVLALYEQELALLRAAAFVHDAMQVGL